MACRYRDIPSEFRENELTANARDWSFLDRIAVAFERGVPMLRFGYGTDFALQNATGIEIRERMADIVLEDKQIFADTVTHYILHDGRRLHALSNVGYDSYIPERARTPDNV